VVEKQVIEIAHGVKKLVAVNAEQQKNKHEKMITAGQPSFRPRPCRKIADIPQP